MLLNGQNLRIDLKAQDAFRKWLADRSINNDLKKMILKSITLGDSDIDYRLSTYYDKINILNAPFQISSIKNKLVFEGASLNFTGKLATYARRILSDGSVASLYNYPPNSTNYLISSNPPTLANGLDITNLAFANDNQRAGWCMFIQTLPDNFFDDSNNQLRYKEKYDIQLTGFPVSGWEFIQDDDNGSFMIAKDQSVALTGTPGLIKIIGKDSSITKTITFNS